MKSTKQTQEAKRWVKRKINIETTEVETQEKRQRKKTLGERPGRVLHPLNLSRTEKSTIYKDSGGNWLCASNTDMTAKCKSNVHCPRKALNHPTAVTVILPVAL